MRIVTSVRSGMGKSLYIQRLGENLRVNLGQADPVHVTIPLHGPVVTPDIVLELFKDHFKRPTCCIYHVDIAPNVSVQCAIGTSFKRRTLDLWGVIHVV